MQTLFKSDRYFCSQNEWFIQMRPGDENHGLHDGLRLVGYIFEGEIPIAGPFKTKRRMFSWFNRFVAMYGKSRSMPQDYIPDSVANNICRC